jgi:hypothetical protein
MMQPFSLSEQDTARLLEYIELADKAIQQMDAVVSREMGTTGPAAEAYIDAGNTLAVVLSKMRDRLTQGSWRTEEGRDGR